MMEDAMNQINKVLQDTKKVLMEDVKELREKVASYQKREKELKEQEELVDTRLKAICDREIKAEIVENRLESARERVYDMKEVVGMVFANNKFKYRESGEVPVKSRNLDGSEYHHTQTVTKEVEGEN